jgi:DNA-binding SARP family transcriptional activator
LRLLIKRGRRTEAPRHYHNVAKRLEEEMELKPMPETSRILDVSTT